MSKRAGSMGIALALGGALAATGLARQVSGEQRVAVVFSGGHETDPRDRGRPVILVAGALGVAPETFREAFSHVHPARDGGPTPEQARQNKAALMGALSKYGVTNERLDEVSNHYRYRRDRGETWPIRPAKAFAIVKEGRIVRFEVTDGGEGYSSPPSVSITGFSSTAATATLRFGQEFPNNGAVRSIALGSVRK